MVGYEEHQQNIGHRIEKGGEQMGVCLAQSDDLPQDASEEKHAVKGIDHHEYGHDDGRSVHACQPFHSRIELAQWPEQQGNERMAVGVVDDIPLAE